MSNKKNRIPHNFVVGVTKMKDNFLIFKSLRIITTQILCHANREMSCSFLFFFKSLFACINNSIRSRRKVRGISIGFTFVYFFIFTHLNTVSYDYFYGFVPTKKILSVLQFFSICSFIHSLNSHQQIIRLNKCWMKIGSVSFRYAPLHFIVRCKVRGFLRLLPFLVPIILFANFLLLLSFWIRRCLLAFSSMSYIHY